MTNRLTQHAKAFAGGFCNLPALMLSIVTFKMDGPGSGDFVDKVQDWSEVSWHDEALMRTTTAGFLSFFPCAVFTAVAIGYVHRSENPSFSDFAQRLRSIPFSQHSVANAQAGAQKVQEAASAAGLIVPKSVNSDLSIKNFCKNLPAANGVSCPAHLMEDQSGTQKVQEAASAAGVIAPKP